LHTETRNAHECLFEFFRSHERGRRERGEWKRERRRGGEGLNDERGEEEHTCAGEECTWTGREREREECRCASEREGVQQQQQQRRGGPVGRLKNRSPSRASAAHSSSTRLEVCVTRIDRKESAAVTTGICWLAPVSTSFMYFWKFDLWNFTHSTNSILVE
jgi:hypothetical protein